jgi:ferrous iron transport protein B
VTQSLSATGAAPGAGATSDEILLVGQPNVGKSALFNRITGSYAVVSNYPGTTVEITRARCTGAHGLHVVDTPGMYSLLPITPEERVARQMVLGTPPRAVVHVIDAKNVRRMLGLTLQLIEAGLPVVVALNMMDEARAAGIEINAPLLEQLLGVSVVPTSAVTGEGVRQLMHVLRSPRLPAPGTRVDYLGMEAHIADLARELSLPQASARTMAMLLLCGEAELRDKLNADDAAALDERLALIRAAGPHSPQYATALALRTQVASLVEQTVKAPSAPPRTLSSRLSDVCMNPFTGAILLAAVLYFGLYVFVGQFGAGTLVELIEGGLFDEWINPWAQGLSEQWIPWDWLRGLFTGEYGIVTLGLRYAVGIILPVVGTFFLAFSVLEDSGYLPRLAMLLDRMLKRIGLSGRAIIPMVLGLGCDTMATVVTRTLQTRRERVIATFLLAIAVPCSAQLGLILALLAGRPAALGLWAGVIAGVFILTGTIAARFTPGKAPSFYMELPPLRLPHIGNVLSKTVSRVVWYLKEVLPLFLIASVLIWLGQITGAFAVLVEWLKAPLRTMGLPGEAAVAFLFGFLRRDYAAAGLYDLQQAGALSGNQLAVAAISLTLFLPCVAQLLVMFKERGWRLALAMALTAAGVAYGVGVGVHLALEGLGVQL